MGKAGHFDLEARGRSRVNIRHAPPVVTTFSTGKGMRKQCWHVARASGHIFGMYRSPSASC